MRCSCPWLTLDRLIIDIKTSESPFLFLAVDLPPPPLFQDAVEKNIIPQVSIHSVLDKYDGNTTQVSQRILTIRSIFLICPQESLGQLRRFKCKRLPKYIILHFKRFTKNSFVEEKNPTIVNFPLRGLDFRNCGYIPIIVCPVFDNDTPSDVDTPPANVSTLYDLIANVTHESVAGTTRDKEHTVWKVHLRVAEFADSVRWIFPRQLFLNVYHELIQNVLATFQMFRRLSPYLVATATGTQISCNLIQFGLLKNIRDCLRSIYLQALDFEYPTTGDVSDIVLWTYYGHNWYQLLKVWFYEHTKHDFWWWWPWTFAFNV